MTKGVPVDKLKYEHSRRPITGPVFVAFPALSYCILSLTKEFMSKDIFIHPPVKGEGKGEGVWPYL